MLSYDRTGTGAPLLLIHPLGAARVVWEPVMPLLARERDVIAVDLPGFGDSPPLPDGDEPTAARLARSAAELLDGLGIETAHVAGNSLGGWVALELERLGRARSVTALAPAGLWSRPLGPRPGSSARSLANAALPLLPLLLRNDPLRLAALSGSVAHPERVPPEAAARLISSYLAAPGFEAANRAMRSSVFDFALTDTPITLVWPERDRLVAKPRRLPAWVRSVDLPDCGHVPTWDAPELVARVLLEGSRDGERRRAA
jgi:pimeloyl-ACP methyl ester carboxylesterase